ncbi:MAG: hypothetical protein ACYTGG_13240 [Planctomycetota bacterium]
MASTNKEQRERLGELINLAQTYRGCNRKELASVLGRDASNLIPDSGVPKIDLVIELANALDWPIESVIRAMCGNGNGRAVVESPLEGSFEQLDEASMAAHAEGRYSDMVDLAKRAFKAAENGEQRARASNREAGGWDGQGRLHNALEALQRGLRESGASVDRQMLLRANLANAYYTLWQLYEGKGLASDVIQRFEETPPETRTAKVAEATALYVRGNCSRRLLAMESGRAQEHARHAIDDLTRSEVCCIQLAAEFENDSYAGIANTCRGGIMESEVILGTRDAEEVLDAYITSLDVTVNPDSHPVGDWLESFGWWCIFGCNVALRHVADERDLQHKMAVFTNKADEIANRLGNWSLRERVFTMEYARRQRFNDWTGVDTEWTIDHEDVRVIAGTMGRFPAFHDTGWQILRSAKVIAEN